jgi:hypothetical protein
MEDSVIVANISYIRGTNEEIGEALSDLEIKTRESKGYVEHFWIAPPEVSSWFDPDPGYGGPQLNAKFHDPEAAAEYATWLTGMRVASEIMCGHEQDNSHHCM